MSIYSKNYVKGYFIPKHPEKCLNIHPENSKYIVRDYSLVKSEAKTENFSTFGAAFTRWNEVCTEIIEEA